MVSAAPRDPQPDTRRAALEYVWAQFKVWDETANRHRRSLYSWRLRVLLLGIAGAVLGTLSAPDALPWLSGWANVELRAGFGIAGGILLGLAAFFSREVLSPERESRWVRARSAAEAFKRESYLLAAKVPPYDGVIDSGSLGRAKDILAAIGEMQEEPIAEEKRREQVPRCPMTVNEYVASRLEEQMNYYRDKAGRHTRVVERVRNLTLVLGAAAVALGVLGGRAGVWLAVITTVTTSLAAYLYANRLQYLAVSYSATARNLDALRAGWRTSGKTEANTAERNQLILDCEGILSTENRSWIAEWAKKNNGAAAGDSLPERQAGTSLPGASAGDSLPRTSPATSGTRGGAD